MNTSLPAGTTRQVAQACPDATEDEIATMINTMAGEAHTSLSGYVASLVRNGDLPDRLALIRADRQKTAIAAELETARRDPDQRCEHGVDGGRHVRSDTGAPLCATCRHRERTAT